MPCRMHKCRERRDAQERPFLLCGLKKPMDGLFQQPVRGRDLFRASLTAYSGVESYIESLSDEIFAYLHKPFVTEELVKIVKAALAQSEANPALPK